MEELFDFSEALAMMKLDEKMKLLHWGDDVYISLQRPTDNSKMTHAYLYVTSRRGMVPWNPTQVELLSIDWKRA